MTQFALKIDEDVIDLFNIMTDQDGLVVNSEDLKIFNVLTSDPTFIDMSHLKYIPYLDSEWDGVNFIDSQNREEVLIQDAKVQDKRFALLVNGKYKLFYGLVDSLENSMIIAALSSNPTILVKG
jgi:hypothetical protein